MCVKCKLIGRGLQAMKKEKAKNRLTDQQFDFVMAILDRRIYLRNQGLANRNLSNKSSLSTCPNSVDDS